MSPLSDFISDLRPTHRLVYLLAYIALYSFIENQYQKQRPSGHFRDLGQTAVIVCATWGAVNMSLNGAYGAK